MCGGVNNHPGLGEPPARRVKRIKKRGKEGVGVHPSADGVWVCLSPCTCLRQSRSLSF